MKIEHLFLSVAFFIGKYIHPSFLCTFAQILLILNKSFKIFLNYFLGPILFIGLSFSIYRHIVNQSNWEQSWGEIKRSLQGEESWKLLIVVFLMLFNWSAEALKWQTLVRHIQPLSFFTAFKAILSGLSVSLALSTPNGSGEYVGRVLYIKEGNRIRAVALTFIGSISQLIVTMLMGVIGLFLLKENFYSATPANLQMSFMWFDAIAYGSVVTTTTLVVLYFRLSWLIQLLEKIPLVAKYSFFIQKIEEFHTKELFKVLLLSFFRYMIFVIQYLLLLHVFKVDIPVWQSMWIITVMFLALAIIPTIALAELGVRGKISIYLFGVFSSNTLGIVLTATVIWLINLVVPALAGSLFILGIKLYRKK